MATTEYARTIRAATNTFTRRQSISIRFDYNDPDRLTLTAALKSAGYRWDGMNKAWKLENTNCAAIDAAFASIPGLVVDADGMTFQGNVTSMGQRELRDEYGPRTITLRYIHTFDQPAANGDRWEYRTSEYQIEEN